MVGNGQRRDKLSPIDDDIAESREKMAGRSKRGGQSRAGETLLKKEAGISNEDGGDEKTAGREDAPDGKRHSIPAAGECPGHEQRQYPKDRDERPRRRAVPAPVKKIQGAKRPEHGKEAGEKACFFLKRSRKKEEAGKEEDINGCDNENARPLIKKISQKPDQEIKKVRDDKTREGMTPRRGGSLIDRLGRKVSVQVEKERKIKARGEKHGSHKYEYPLKVLLGRP
jgi:hypothetical protein